MKTTALKLAAVSACFAFAMTACSSNQTNDGQADSDSLLMPTESFETDTMMSDTIGTGTNGMGTATDTTTGTGTTPMH